MNRSTQQSQVLVSPVDSDDSSMIATSAQFSLATTDISTLLSLDNQDTLETNSSRPLLSLAAVTAGTGLRRHSLVDTQSMVPTLPPYEIHHQHISEYEYQIRPVVDEERARETEGTHINNEPGNAEMSAFLTATNGQSMAEDTGNEMTAHYSQIVRTIDSRYNDEIERLRAENVEQQRTHEEAQASMRNSIDASYRIVLRKRDKEVQSARDMAIRAQAKIEDLLQEAEQTRRDVAKHDRDLKIKLEGWKTLHSEALDQVQRLITANNNLKYEAESAKEQHRLEIDKVGYTIEDEWETRWQTRTKLSEEELLRNTVKIKDARDLQWIQALHHYAPDLLDANLINKIRHQVFYIEGD